MSLFALTRETAVLMRELAVPGSGALDMHLLDDLLVIHRPLSKLTLLYDVRAKGSRSSEPVVTPLPLVFKTRTERSSNLKMTASEQRAALEPASGADPNVAEEEGGASSGVFLCTVTF